MVSVTSMPSWMELYGALVIANIINSVLTGVVIVITIWYFATQRSDGVWNKVVVGVLFLTSTLDTALGSLRVIQMTVLHPADLIYYSNLRSRPNEVAQVVTLDLCALFAQGFMASKVISFALKMRMTYSIPMTRFFWGASALLAMAFCGSCGISIYQAYLFHSYSSYVQLYKPGNGNTPFETITTAQISAFLFMDVILMVSLTVIFKQAKTGFQGSNPIITALINNTLRNGVGITICQITALGLNQSGQLLWAVIPAGVLSKVYVLTVLSILIRPRQVQKSLQKKLDLEALSPLEDGIIASGGTITNPSSGSGVGSITPNLNFATLKCQVCGSASTAIMMPNGGGYAGTPRLGSSTPTLGGLGFQLRNREVEGAIGFKAALMGLDEISDEKHETNIEDSKEENEGTHKPEVADKSGDGSRREIEGYGHYLSG